MGTESEARFEEIIDETKEVDEVGSVASISSVHEEGEKILENEVQASTETKREQQASGEKASEFLETESEVEDSSDEYEDEPLSQPKKLTKPKHMPPPAKAPERPPAVFDHNVLGMLGMIVAGIQIYALKDAGLEFRSNGLDVLLSFAGVTYFMAAAWAFLSNLEGFTRFPYITLLFVVFGFIPPIMSKVLGVDSTGYNEQVFILYNTFIWGPLVYILFCTFCAIVNAENEKEHGFKGTFYS